MLSSIVSLSHARLSVVVAALIRLQHAQDDCDAGSCHPAVGDLLLGRSKQLTASSTCGMNGPQKYCIISYLEAEQKCFLCDSRYPYNPYTQHNSHMIENVITTFEPDRRKKWWQSENGVDHVSIRLDLETLFQFSHLILTFKVVLKALDPSFEIGNPYVPYIQELITLTNLRINFTKLHTLGDALLGRRHSDPLEKYYYAVYEMVVRGSCFCNGHASQCDPVQKLRGDVFHQSGMVGYWGLGNSLYGCSPCDCDIGGSQNNLCSPKDGQCKCLPNIVSRQCNEPAPGYFFLPLDCYIYEAEHAKPLSGSAPLVKPSTLPRCDIYFQKQGYEFMIENGKIVLNRSKKRSIRKSGLEQGAMQFGQDSAVAVVFRQPSTSRSVTWTGPGFAHVPSGAGLRFAVNNVPFAMDFYIMIRYEPELGLIPRIGSVENLCSEKDLDEYQKYHCIEIASEVGPHVLPEACARLIVSMSARIHNGAVACKCNPQGSLNTNCSKLGGQCQCKANVVGRCCDTCSAGSYGFGFHGCYACECNPEGTSQPKCDKATGVCNCRAGVTGRFCDQCGRSFEKDFPSCRQCHLCFDQWDTEIIALAQTVQGLMRFAANLEDKGGRMPSCDMRFKAFEDAISEIERILRHPVLSLEALSGIKDFQSYVQRKVAQMDPLHSMLYEFPDLNKNIEDIGEEADLVYELLQQKIHLHQSFHYLNVKEAISNIRKQFEVSLLAEQKTSGTTPTVRYLQYTRNHMLAMLGNQVLKASSVLEQLKRIKSPDIQNLIEKVESVRKMADDSKLKGSQFNEQLERAKNQIEVDGEITKEFIRKVKDFLLDESVPPEDIEKVANYVLQINLPLTRELTGMLGKIRSIMNHCEKYKLNANKRNRKRKEARTLLVEAQEANKAAKALPPVDEINNKLKNVVKSQGHSKNTFIKLNEEIQGIRTQISQAENQANKTNDELNGLSAKQSEMENEIATLQAKMLMNKNQATKARAGAEAAHKRAQNIDNEFADIKRKYAILQEKLKAQGPPKVTLEKVKQLKEEAEKLAEETEKKIKRITDLEKKLQDLNQTKQDKAEQLRQLEQQVIAIKNEITGQESKYATCKS
ncbi:laminin subunit beta-4 [Grus japonensis]|uniref:Laminin subunit beta-4 n=1 Tax=Grus japonensis TaxID=30415 RepID=A0ABC9VQQ0_GRUJA